MINIVFLNQYALSIESGANWLIVGCELSWVRGASWPGRVTPPPHRRLRVFNTSVLGLSIGVEDNEGFDSDFPLSLTFSDWMPVWKSIPEVIWLTMYPEKCDLANHVPWKMLRLKSYNAQLIFQLQSFPYDPKYIDL